MGHIPTHHLQHMHAYTRSALRTYSHLIATHTHTHTQADVTERLECQAVAGGNARNSKKALDVNCHAMVATPLLDFSERSLLFQLSYMKGEGTTGAGETSMCLLHSHPFFNVCQ